MASRIRTTKRGAKEIDMKENVEVVPPVIAIKQKAKTNKEKTTFENEELSVPPSDVLKETTNEDSKKTKLKGKKTAAVTTNNGEESGAPLAVTKVTVIQQEKDSLSKAKSNSQLNIDTSTYSYEGPKYSSTPFVKVTNKFLNKTI